ncbi:MAG: exo-alpha-sialidase [Clostridia bacterium]|nr:exo-alpha-sialidase [Clostridia bacterium]
MEKKKFHLELGEPVAVAQGENSGWGPYQFPKMFRTKSGAIYCNWLMGADTVEGGGRIQGAPNAVSDDDGKTWRAVTPEDTVAYDAMMPNGKAFAYFNAKSAHTFDYDLGKYNKACDGIQNTGVYFADDIKELDRSISATEYDPATGEKQSFPVTLNWPYMPVSYYRRSTGDLVYPPCQVMAISNYVGLLKLDDGLYFCTYTRGFDSKTGEVTKYSKYFSVYVFRTTDCARTWDYVSQVSIDDETFIDNGGFEGFCESKMEKMPDGSVVMLMRTGGNHPSYLVRSTDNCRTWSKPVLFDSIGVFPQILALDCGVTIAAYGRPEMHLRATSDPAGLDWEAPIRMELSPGEGCQSCYYTYLLPLDGNTALMVYSDFHFPNENGEPKKSIVVRTIKAVIDD